MMLSNPFQMLVFPEVAKRRLQQLLDIKHDNIVSKSATDISRTNLIELDIPTEGLPVASKPYTVPLKYREFVEHEIKQLKEAEIISRSLSDWASPILVVPRKRSEQRIPVIQAPQQVVIITNSISDYVSITENSISTP